MIRGETKSRLLGLFAWAGIPVLFAGAARLAFFFVHHGRLPATFPVNTVLVGIMLALIVVGVVAVREGHFGQTWMAPIYAITMLAILFAILASTACLSGEDCTT